VLLRPMWCSWWGWTTLSWPRSCSKTGSRLCGSSSCDRRRRRSRCVNVVYMIAAVNMDYITVCQGVGARAAQGFGLWVTSVLLLPCAKSCIRVTPMTPMTYTGARGLFERWERICDPDCVLCCVVCCRPTRLLRRCVRTRPQQPS
jgi:hypothetical protein